MKASMIESARPTTTAHHRPARRSGSRKCGARSTAVGGRGRRRPAAATTTATVAKEMASRTSSSSSSSSSFLIVLAIAASGASSSSSSSSSSAHGFDDDDGRLPALLPRRRLARDDDAVFFGGARPPRRRTAFESDLFGDDFPPPTDAAQQNLLWGDTNDDMTMMVPLLPFRLVLSGVPPPPSSSPSASSSSSTIFDPLVEYLESAWAEAFASNGAYGGRFRGVDVGGIAEVDVLPPTTTTSLAAQSRYSASSSSTSSSSTTTTVVLTLGGGGSVTFDGAYWEADPTSFELTSFLVRAGVDAGGLREIAMPILCGTTTRGMTVGGGGGGGGGDDSSGGASCDLGVELTMSAVDDGDEGYAGAADDVDVDVIDADEQQHQGMGPSGGETESDGATSEGGGSAASTATTAATAAEKDSGPDRRGGSDPVVVVSGVVGASMVALLAIAGFIAFHRRKTRRQQMDGDDDGGGVKISDDGGGEEFAESSGSMKGGCEGGDAPPVAWANAAYDAITFANAAKSASDMSAAAPPASSSSPFDAATATDAGVGGGGGWPRQGEARRSGSAKKIDIILDDLASAADSSLFSESGEGGAGGVGALFVPSSGPPIRPMRGQEPFVGEYRCRSAMATLNLRKDMLREIARDETTRGPPPAVGEDCEATARGDGYGGGDAEDPGASAKTAGSAEASFGKGYSDADRAASPRKSISTTEIQRAKGRLSLRGVAVPGHGRNIDKTHCGGQRRDINKKGGDDRLLPAGFQRSDFVDSVDLGRTASTDSSSDGSGCSDANFSWV